MEFRTLLKSAYLALKANKTRSLLTTLGIIIGVATVISMVSIIDGMNRYVYQILGSLGSKTVYVQKWKWAIRTTRMSREEVRKILRRPDLTLEDAEAIRELPEVELAAASQPIWAGLRMRHKNKTIELDPEGVEEDFLPIAGYEVEYGRGLNRNDILYKRNVVVIGKYVAENLFPDEDPIGKELEIGGYKFLVIGVLKEKGELMGNNLDEVAFIPITTAQKLFINKTSRRYRIFASLRILAKVRDDVPMEEGLKSLETLMRKRRNLRFNDESNFSLNTQEMLLDAYKKLTNGIFFAMIGIASLALIVGGIGIMNIMLVSVTERTREIGVRMAVGAKRKDILMQFLVEAIFLTTVGGLIGVIIGSIIGKLVDIATPLPSAIPLWSILVGLGFSTFVGLFFGIYPAQKAAKLDPIEALRYE